MEIKSGKSWRFSRRYTFTVRIPLDEVFVDATRDDIVLLVSDDDVYEKMLKVREAGEKEGEAYVRLTFRGIIPGKQYTLSYGVGADDEKKTVLLVTLFSSRLLQADDLETPLLLEAPFDETVDPGAPSN